MSGYVYNGPSTKIQTRQTTALAAPGATQIGFVVDQSGSMESVKSETVNGFNKLLAEQKGSPREAALSLALFNERVRLVHDAVPIADVPLLSHELYVPAGGTALNDGIGYMIQAIGKRASRLTPVLVVILTDGLDTSSSQFSAADVRQMIAYRRLNHDWEFLFLGPRSGLGYAASIGIPEDHVFGFEADSKGITRILDRLSASLEAYRLGDRQYTLLLKGRE